MPKKKPSKPLSEKDLIEKYGADKDDKKVFPKLIKAMLNNPKDKSPAK